MIVFESLETNLKLWISRALLTNWFSAVFCAFLLALFLLLIYFLSTATYFDLWTTYFYWFVSCFYPYLLVYLSLLLVHKSFLLVSTRLLVGFTCLSAVSQSFLYLFTSCFCSFLPVYQSFYVLGLTIIISDRKNRKSS